MIELILLALCACALAKRKPFRRRNWNSYLSGVLEIDKSLTTLASKALTSATSETVIESMRVSSIRATWAISDFTPGANIGPIICGVAHSDYDDTEIESWVEDAGSWNLGNLTAREIRTRRIRQVGVFSAPGAANLDMSLNDGRPIKTKLNWVLTTGDGLKFWAYNTGGQDIATTVPNMTVFGRANLWRM